MVYDTIILKLYIDNQQNTHTCFSLLKEKYPFTLPDTPSHIEVC